MSGEKQETYATMQIGQEGTVAEIFGTSHVLADHWIRGAETLLKQRNGAVQS